MYLTENRENDSSVSRGIFRFYGLDRKRRPSRGEMEAMYNMTSAEFPCAAPAPSRAAVVTTGNDIQAVAAPDALISDSVDGLTGVMGGEFYYNGVKRSGSYVLRTDYEWTIARLGMVYIINGTGDGVKETFTFNADTKEFRPFSKTMDYLIVTAGKDNSGDWYLETYRYYHTAVSNHTVTLDDGSQMDGGDFYYRYKSYEKSENIFEKNFKIGDELEIIGFPGENSGGRLWYYPSTGDSESIHEVTNYNTSVNNTVDLTAARMSEINRDSIVHATVKKFDVTLAGQRYAHRIFFELLDKAGEKNAFVDMIKKHSSSYNYYAQGVTLRLAYPSFSDLTVHDGRLWGTTTNNEHIYGSASDDISDFSSDSINERLAVRITPYLPGAFTGICSYGGHLLVFKENAIIRRPGKDLMNSIARAVLTAYTYDTTPDLLDIETNLRQSIELIAGFPTIAAYQATKSYLLKFSKGIHYELSHYGVKVCCVCPGAVDTDLYNLPVKMRKRLRAIGVMMSPEQIAKRGVRATLHGRKVKIPGPINYFFLLLCFLLPGFVINLVKKKFV